MNANAVKTTSVITSCSIFELRQTEHAIPDSIRLNLKTVFQQRDQPTGYNGENQRATYPLNAARSM
jgi:hypothetical protein